MKTTYFRIIELRTHQVLLTKDFDADNNNNLLIVCFFMDGVKGTLTMGFDTLQKRDAAFDNYTDKSAQTFIDEAYAMHS